VDVSVDNPNVWYELGVRHALRARGVVIISSSRTKAFDIYTDRKFSYSVANGVPDSAKLQDEIEALAKMIKATMESWHGRKISPVYSLLPNLQEPDWKSLQVGEVREFWELHEAWEKKIKLAGQNGQIGDILLLADEAPVTAFRSEGWIKAGNALVKEERFDFALEQYDRALAVNPTDLQGLQKKGVCLQRLGAAGQTGHSLDRARIHYKAVLKDYPKDAETWALLGRVDKDAWTESWQQSNYTPEQMRKEASYEDELLRAAIESYLTGYRQNTNHYYSGINALTLMFLLRHLTGDNSHDQELHDLVGAIRIASQNEQDENLLFWALATLGDVEVLIGTPDSVRSAYKKAIVKNEKDWFSLNSSRAQLLILKNLGFNLENTNAGIETFDRALAKAVKPVDKWQPKQVFLFSGHLVDEPGRTPARFPPEKESEAAEKIEEALARYQAGPGDLALTQGACGGDILFTEACHRRGVNVHWLQPFRESTFIEKSVVRSYESWRQRYYDAKSNSGVEIPIRSAPLELGEPPSYAKSGYAYERCNLWLLYTALSYGIEKINFICLWDGKGGDGPGGTAHMYNEVKNRTGRVTRVNIW